MGLGLDLNTTNFHARWSLLSKAREWNDRLGLGLAGEAFDRWVVELRESFGPALSANRTMGALGSIVASRVAREFRLGGPSFTVSAEEASGLRALDIACRLLRQGELDEAIVGAVDLPGDLRASMAEESIHPSTVLADGAAVAILKRLDDAVRDGDRIYAVVRGVGVATGDLTPDANAYLASAARAFAESGVDPSRVGLVLTGGAGGQDVHGRGRSPQKSSPADGPRPWRWPRPGAMWASPWRLLDLPRSSRPPSASTKRSCPRSAKYRKRVTTFP